MSGSLITLIVLGVAAGYLVMVYNQLVSLRNRHANAFSQIDVQLQRRHELIPNLVEVAKEYMRHESETLTAVIDARNTASSRLKDASASPENPTKIGALARAESSLGQAMSGFNLVVENYPELKADARMSDLHQDLTSTENRVGFARQAYSDAGMEYNTECEKFPNVLVARLCAFRPADLFELENEQARSAVKVSFDKAA